MNKQLTHSSFTSTLRLASAAGSLIILAGSAAQAQTVEITSPPAGFTSTPTAPYPVGDSAQNIYGPFTVAAGSTNVTFTATNTTAGSPSFLTFDNFDSNLDFPSPTTLVDTSDGGPPTGPLLINFSSGVSAFGINAEDNAVDQETFTFSTYNGSMLLNTFVTGPYDNATQAKSAFLGAVTTGPTLITSVVISSFSLATDKNTMQTSTDGSNDFYFGPLSIYTANPVPEASTTISFGLLLALGLSGAAFSARKKSALANASA